MESKSPHKDFMSPSGSAESLGPIKTKHSKCNVFSRSIKERATKVRGTREAKVATTTIAVLRKGVIIEKMSFRQPSYVYLMLLATCLNSFLGGFNDYWTRRDDDKTLLRENGIYVALSLLPLAYYFIGAESKKRAIYLSSAVIAVRGLENLYLKGGLPASEDVVAGIAGYVGMIGSLIYVSECSPPGIRGAMLYSVLISKELGHAYFALLSLLTPDVPRTKDGRMANTGQLNLNDANRHKDLIPHWWYASVPILAITQIFLLAMCPRSPHESVSENQMNKAQIDTRRLFGEEMATKKLAKIQRSEQDQFRTKFSVLGIIRHVPHIRKAVLIGFTLPLMAGLVDLDGIVFGNQLQFMYKEYGLLKGKSINSLLLIMRTVTVSFMPVACYLIERLGRRRVLMLGYMMLTYALLLFCMEFNTSNRETSDFAFSNKISADICSDHKTCLSCISVDRCRFCYTKNETFLYSKLGFCFDLKDVTRTNETDQCAGDDINYGTTSQTCPPIHPNVFRVAVVLFGMINIFGIRQVTDFYVAESVPPWILGPVISLEIAFMAMVEWARFEFLQWLDVKEWGFYVLLARGLISCTMVLFVYLYVPEVRGAAIQDTDIFFMNRAVNVTKNVLLLRENQEKRAGHAMRKTKNANKPRPGRPGDQ